MEISSEDDVMEDISHEELQDEIEDGDISNSNLKECFTKLFFEVMVPHFIVKLNKTIYQTDAGSGMYFCLQNQDIEKFVLLGRQLKRSKNLWLVQNPEKLLLPDADNSNHDPETDDIESFVQSVVTVGRIFREALSRSGMDLVEHYKLMQENPSKIPGALRFDIPTTDRDLNDLSSTVYIDMLEQEPQNHDLEKSVQQNKLDEIMSFCEDEKTSWWKRELPPLQGTGNMISPQTSSHSSACQKNSLVTGEAYWDNFSWSTGLTATDQRIESIADHCVQSPKCNKKSGTEDTVGNCISSAYGISSLLGVMEVCANASTAEPHEALQSAEVPTVLQPNCASSESIQSSGALNDMEVANQDVYVSEKDEHETLNSAAVEGSTISCLSSETAVRGVEGLMKDCQVQAYQVEEKSLHLDELITGAVMAECQLHQKTFSHYDLEPLSRLLTAHVTSIYQKQKTNVMEFKDLVDACSGAPEITLQRYFVALLGAAHQHNMGNLKDFRMEGLQILLEEGISGRLSEVTINLSPC